MLSSGSQSAKCTDEEYHAIQNKVSKLILKNIETRGLLPRDRMTNERFGYLGSADGMQAGFLAVANQVGSSGATISINEMQVGNLRGAQLAAKLKYLMNERSAGAWPIVLERSYQLIFGSDTAALKAEFEERLKHSILFVLNPQSGGFKKGIIPDQCHSVMFYENRLKRGVARDQIICILVPQHLKTVVESVFPTVPVQVIQFKKEPVILPVYEVSKYWPQRRLGADVKVSMNVPDFDTGLKEFIEKNAIQPTIACHVVRLQTFKDTQYHLHRGLEFFERAGFKKQGIPIQYLSYVDALLEVRMEIIKEKMPQEEERTQAAIVLQSAVRAYQGQRFFVSYMKLHKEAAAQLSSHQIADCQSSLARLSEMRDSLR